MNTKMKWITAKFKYLEGDKEDLELYFPIHVKQKKRLSKKDLLGDIGFKQYMNDCASKIMFQPIKVFSLSMPYSDVEQVRTSKYNTIIEVRIPYVFHIPNQTETTIKYPQKAKVSFYKQRTNKTKDCDNFEVLGKKTLFYSKNSNLITPEFPLHPSKGRKAQPHEISNCEINDGSGYLRYSILLIEINTGLTKDKLEQEKEINNLREKITEITNYLISIYRDITKDYLMKPLNTVEIHDIYLVKENIGLYSYNPNMSSAIINHSNKVFNDFLQKTKTGFKVPIYKELLDNAKAYLAYKQYKLSIIESFQAVDVFIESFVSEKLKSQGKTIDTFLISKKQKRWNTKFGLDKGLKEVIGKEFTKLNNGLYKKRENNYKKYRNNIIHKEPIKIGLTQSKRIISTNESVIKRILKEIST